jgi:hypothetical protein
VPDSEVRIEGEKGRLTLVLDDSGEIRETIPGPSSTLALDDLAAGVYILVSVPAGLELDVDVLAFDRTGDNAWAQERGYGAVLATLQPSGERLPEDPDGPQQQGGGQTVYFYATRRVTGLADPPSILTLTGSRSSIAPLVVRSARSTSERAYLYGTAGYQPPLVGVVNPGPKGLQWIEPAVASVALYPGVA